MIVPESEKELHKKKNKKLLIILATVPFVLSLFLVAYCFLDSDVVYMTDAEVLAEKKMTQEVLTRSKEVQDEMRNLMGDRIEPADSIDEEELADEEEEITEYTDITDVPDVKPTPEPKIPEATKVEAPKPETKPATTVKPATAAPSKTGLKYKTTAAGSPETIVVEPGISMLQISRNLYNSPSFWGYIFDANRDVLKSPSQMQAGMTLKVPNPEYYDIRVGNAESVKKASDFARNIQQ